MHPGELSAGDVSKFVNRHRYSGDTGDQCICVSLILYSGEDSDLTIVLEEVSPIPMCGYSLVVCSDPLNDKLHLHASVRLRSSLGDSKALFSGRENRPSTVCTS